MTFKQTDSIEPVDRWYVLVVLTLVYSLNIADRLSMSTLIEPIRLELHLSDSGAAFLTGVSLALFFVTVGVPIAVLADRVNRRNILAIALAVWSCMTVLCDLRRTIGSCSLPESRLGSVRPEVFHRPHRSSRTGFRRHDE